MLINDEKSVTDFFKIKSGWSVIIIIGIIINVTGFFCARASKIENYMALDQIEIEYTGKHIANSIPACKNDDKKATYKLRITCTKLWNISS